MANYVFNSGKGKTSQFGTDGSDLRLLVLKASAAQSTNEDFATVAALIANAGNTEADFTNYTRKVLAGVNTVVDNANNKSYVDANDVVYSSAGGASNNTCVSVVIYKHVTNDADSIPLVHLDAAFTTDGNDVTLQFNAGGFFEAS